MLFFSPLFLILFLPLVLALYLFVRDLFKDYILLIASLLFYFWGEPSFVFIALFSATADYSLAKQIYKLQNRQLSKYLTALGIVLNILLLSYFKYVDFFISSANQILNLFHIQGVSLLNIALPIGVSFIVFEKITYLVDIYRQKGKPANSLRTYLLYIFLFPKLLAGPIIKYHDIANQLTRRQFTLEDCLQGLKRFLQGFIKKILLADTLSELSIKAFNLPADQLSGVSAWLGILTFTLQVYLDFSAYSDMAIGLARMFGFKLRENFNMPFTAANISDFWQRWHISLSSWIKEYLYIPLGGNKLGTIRTYLNLWICFLICGLWHGAKWNYVLYGAYFGLFIVLDKLFWIKLSQHIPKLINILLTFLILMMGLVIFRCNTFSQTGNYYLALLHPWREGIYIYVTYNVWTALACGLWISFFPSSKIYNMLKTAFHSLQISLVVENWLISFLSFVAFSRVLVTTFNPFLYFKF